MARTLLTLAILGPTAVVVAAVCVVLWRERASTRDARTVIVSGVVLALWALVATVLAQREFFQPEVGERVPPVGIHLLVVLTGLAISLTASSSLRRLLGNQANLIRLHLWRLVGLVFLALMVAGRVPALWALPAGIGDVLIAVTAPWVARHVDSPRGRRRAIAWNLLGMADLVVAVGLGIMTSPGPTQVFRTTPTTELMTHFPLALVPTFLVPLAFTLHVVSLWQLMGGTWSPRPADSSSLRHR